MLKNHCSVTFLPLPFRLSHPLWMLPLLRAVRLGGQRATRGLCDAKRRAQAARGCVEWSYLHASGCLMYPYTIKWLLAVFAHYRFFKSPVLCDQRRAESCTSAFPLTKTNHEENLVISSVSSFAAAFCDISLGGSRVLQRHKYSSHVP